MFFARLQAELAVGVGEFGKPRVGQQRAVAENLVKNIRLLQVIQLFGCANKGRHRELLVGQQFEKGLEGDQCGHPGNLPASGSTQYLIDLVELRDAVVGQAQLFDALHVLGAGAAFQQFQLAGNQRVPHPVLGRCVVDKAIGIRLTGDVFRLLHGALRKEIVFIIRCCCDALVIPQVIAVCS